MRFLVSIGVSCCGMFALSACQTNSPYEWTEAITFEERVVLQSPRHIPRQSLSVLNLGPGPVEVFLVAQGAHTHPIELQEGIREYVMLDEPMTVEILHPASGTARIEWSVHPHLDERIRVEIDGPPAEAPPGP